MFLLTWNFTIRRVDQGPYVPGPYAYAYANASVIDTEGGTGAILRKAVEENRLCNAQLGDLLDIDGVLFEIVPDHNRNIALVRVGMTLWYYRATNGHFMPEVEFIDLKDLKQKFKDSVTPLVQYTIINTAAVKHTMRQVLSAQLTTVAKTKIGLRRSLETAIAKLSV